MGEIVFGGWKGGSPGLGYGGREWEAGGEEGGELLYVGGGAW